MRHVAAHSPFYRRKFAELGLDPGAVRSQDDLPYLGFYTFPADIRADPFQFLSVPRRDVLYAMSSSGTTGKSKIIFFSKRDWTVIVRIVGNGLTMLGATQDDVAQIMFSYGNPSWPTGSLMQGGLERLGAFIVPAGNSVPIDQQFALMERFGTTMLFGTPSYMHRLTQEGQARRDLRALGVRLIRLGAEPWSEALRSYLQEAWGAAVYDAYGMIELGAVGAGECSEHNGLHLSPYVLVEVVDPQTGELLPRGELGELVFTTLLQQASPFLRYRSGDLGRLLPDELCPCLQLPTDRLSRIVGRADDMLFLGSGENAFPAQFDTALIGLEGLSGYQVVVDKRNHMDLITIRAEATAPGEPLKQEIARRLYDALAFLDHEIHQSQTIAPLRVEFLEPGCLQEESTTKVRRLVDRRHRAVETEGKEGH
jgi:phenylacetate-CoA ligase